MPTGGGKSLCYQLPAMALPGMGVVVSPLIALMSDQVLALEQLEVSAAYLNSSQSPHEQDLVMQRAAAGELDLLYVAPERLLQPATLEFLKHCTPNLFAIDEAHCVSTWGHDFREDYLHLHQLKERFPEVPRIALTATADERTRDDIVFRLKLQEPDIYIEGFDRPNICYTVHPKQDPKRQILEFLMEHKQEAGIVYCLSRKSVDQTAFYLSEQGYRALPYHAGLDSQTRSRHQARFLSEDGVIIVATIAFGMGIDKPDVRFVVHMDLPKSVEAYYQETGRGGRDGQPADAWMIYGLQDVVRLGRMVDESQADPAHKRIERTKLDGLLGWCELTTCRRQALLHYFGEQGPEYCGNCDICLTPPVTWDATEAAQKALSCVYRTGQRFGAAYVTDVLRGEHSDRIVQNGHDRLSTFAIGTEISDQQWRSIYRQLVVRGYLLVDHAHHGALKLSEKSRALLKGDAELKLREDQSKVKKRRPKSTYKLEIEDEPLMDALRELRKAIATEAGIPPYVVFHDATLLEMVELRPKTAASLLELTGVGQAKLSKYGEPFLHVISTH